MDNKNLTVLHPPFLWDTTDKHGNRVVLTESTWAIHEGLPGHLNQADMKHVVEQADVRYYDRSDDTFKYYDMVDHQGQPRVGTVAVNPATSPHSVRTAFGARKIARHVQASAPPEGD